MSILMIVRVALKALARNKLRTSLTMLGMIIGVGAVIAMVALGSGAQAAIEDQIRGAGTNMIMMFPGAATTGGVRSAGDGEPADAVGRQGAQGICRTSTIVSEGLQTQQQVIAGSANWRTSIVGVNVDYVNVKSWPTEVRRILHGSRRHRAPRRCARWA